MSYFPDFQIKKFVENGDITIDPYFDTFQGPNLYYCHLGNRFLIPKDNLPNKVDPLKINSSDLYSEFTTNKPIVIKSGGFMLAETFEFLGTSENYVIRLFNSSSLARIGVSQAAIGMINPGCGYSKPIKLTLELVNNFPRDIVLTPSVIQPKGKIIWGTEVLKIAVSKMEKRPSVSYDEWKNAVYQSDQKVVGPKMKARFDTSNLRLQKSSLHNKIK